MLGRVSIHLVTGDDESLVRHALGELVHRLVGDGDRALMVDDFDDDEYVLAAVVDAAQTPPLFTDRRVVVARGLARFSSADDVGDLVQYLADPLDSTDLVLVAGGRLPKSLAEALKKAGVVTTDSSPPSQARQRGEWFAEHIAHSGLRLDAAATTLLGSWLGEDAGRLQGVLDTLLSAYGTGGRLGVDEIQPFLGEAGGVPPWDLTDALDRGDTRQALTVLHRMMQAGERHPLQVMSILHGHYAKLLALDGSGARDEASAAAAIGIKPGYPARKALDVFRKLGPAPVHRAIGLLADADLDLRGAKDWPDAMVMEVLVARLSKLLNRRA